MDFLYAIFDWVVFSSLVASLMVPILLLVKFAFKDKLSPSWHHVIWFLLLTRLVLPFAPASPVSILNVVPSLKHMIQNIDVVPTLAQTDSFNAVPPAADAVETRNHPQSSSAETLPDNSVGMLNSVDHIDRTNAYLIALLIWLTGATIFGIYVAFINGRLLLRIRASAQAVQEPLKQVLEQCKTTLKIRSDIPLVMTPIVRTQESMGATIQDVQNILLKQGAVNAALLDGGSLSTMYFDGNVVNNLSAGEQIVSSAFLVMP